MTDMAFQEHFVEADSFRIRYLEAGRGEPVACLHGGGGLRLSPMYDLLAADFRVIAFEIPGFGDSPTNERTKSAAELAATMNAAMTALGIDKFNLLANSFTGKAALNMAMQAPERIESVVLIAPAAFPPEFAGRPPTPEQLRDMVRPRVERQPAPPPRPEVMAKQLGLAQRMMAPNPDPDFEAKLAQLKVPVLTVLGTEDRLIPPTFGRRYREKLGNCHVVMVYDAGHLVDLDRPEAVFAVVDNFLKRREKFIVNIERGAIFA
jgi:pimeloyl-ACP methyl ester carboxylesterase